MTAYRQLLYTNVQNNSYDLRLSTPYGVYIVFIISMSQHSDLNVKLLNI